MPDSNQPTQTISDDVQIVPLAFKPGIRRDGTRLETNEFRDGKWTRWHNGRARKIGGYKQAIKSGLGPMYSAHVYTQSGLGYTHMGSYDGIMQTQIDQTTGLATAPVNRTPAGYVSNADNLWSFNTFYDEAPGTSTTQLLAFVAPNLTDIDSNVAGTLYAGSVTAATALTSITGAPAWPPGNPPTVDPSAPSVSGGFFVCQPFVIGYGSSGFVAWSDEGLPQTWNTRSAGADRVQDRKFVFGSAVRGSNVPSMLLWSQNALVRGTYSNGPSIFSFNTVTDEISIMSSRCVAQANGIFFWPGKDCFFMYDGAVREVPNQFNADWFFENINFSYRQAVWCQVNWRFGEIWWFFPYGSATTCTHAVIYNYRYQYWYDTILPADGRYGGYNDGTLKWPVMGGHGGNLWLHEYGYDKIVGSVVTPLQAYYETSDIAFPTTGPGKSGWVGQDRNIKILRIEPDWKSDQSGSIDFTIKSRKYPMDTTVNSQTFTMPQGTTVQDMKYDGRLMGFKFESNVQGGSYQQGDILIHIGPDDGRP